MSVPSSFTFFSKNQNMLTWTVTDVTGANVNSASVTATLYFDRDPIDPDLNPGDAVPTFTDVSLLFNVQDQKYEVVIPATFDPPVGGNYTLVVDASNAGVGLGHWERRAVVTEGP
jgi:hypothetical protein